jgi:hypothetical protein
MLKKKKKSFKAPYKLSKHHGMQILRIYLYIYTHIYFPGHMYILNKLFITCEFVTTLINDYISHTTPTSVHESHAHF